MSTDYNARAVIRGRTPLEDVVDALAEYAAAASPAGRHHTEVTITVPATGVRQAISTALALLEDVGQVEALEVLTTEAFDARQGLTPLPELLSVTEAAEALGVTRQAVLQRLESGSLPGRKVGKTWVVPAAGVH